MHAVLLDAHGESVSKCAERMAMNSAVSRIIHTSTYFFLFLPTGLGFASVYKKPGIKMNKEGTLKCWRKCGDEKLRQKSLRVTIAGLENGVLHLRVRSKLVGFVRCCLKRFSNTSDIYQFIYIYFCLVTSLISFPYGFAWGVIVGQDNAAQLSKLFKETIGEDVGPGGLGCFDSLCGSKPTAG